MLNSKVYLFRKIPPRGECAPTYSGSEVNLNSFSIGEASGSTDNDGRITLDEDPETMTKN